MWTKIKGLLGLGAVGAGLGAIFGGGWLAVSGLLGGAFALNAVANGAIVFGSFGFFTTTGLGVFLAKARSKASLEDVSVLWAGLIGAAAGAAFPLVFNVLMLQSLLPLQLIAEMLPIMGTLGLAGGTMTTAMVAAAKRDHRKALASGLEAPLLEE